MTRGVTAPPYAPVHSHVHVARTRAPGGRRVAGHTRLAHRLGQLLSDLPLLVRVGLLVLGLGALADLAYHALPISLAPLLGQEGLWAHLVTFVGMLITIVGLIRQGLAAVAHSSQGVSSHAHR